jgi:hypothetical protein
VAARPELVHGLAVAEEDRLLIFLDDQLRAQFDIGRALGGHAGHQRAIRFVEVLQNL